MADGLDCGLTGTQLGDDTAAAARAMPTHAALDTTSASTTATPTRRAARATIGAILGGGWLLKTARMLLRPQD